jgi:hypothetical protein
MVDLGTLFIKSADIKVMYEILKFSLPRLRIVTT